MELCLNRISFKYHVSYCSLLCVILEVDIISFKLKLRQQITLAVFASRMLAPSTIQLYRSTSHENLVKSISGHLPDLFLFFAFYLSKPPPLTCTTNNVKTVIVVVMIKGHRQPTAYHRLSHYTPVGFYYHGPHFTRQFIAKIAI